MHARAALFLALMCVLLFAQRLAAEDLISLGQASIVLRSRDPIVANAARVLIEEVKNRTGLNWQVSAAAPSAGGARIILAVLPRADETSGDGFRLSVDAKVPAVEIVGNGPRGVLFGVGHLLRKSQWRWHSLELPRTAQTETVPKYPLRGHQLGYRHRANSYDKWDERQYEQYIRELALFGANSIENIPTEGGRASDHMVLSRQAMNTRLSQICAQYGLDFWMWIPAPFDLKDADRRAASLVEHDTIYRTCPRVDHVFFPGGDPGNNHPREVLSYLAEVAEVLKKHHPDAKIWLSMQGFHGQEVEYVFDWLENDDPRDWLGGLVAGPGSPPIPQTRARLAGHYGLRHYPDINHVVRCQYPVSYWDPAYARTHTREPVTVRPRFQQLVHNTYAPYTIGFVTYSDGIHDDVNKAVWSQLGWDPDRDLREILEDYARFFLSAKDAPRLADMLLALERNWEGPLDTNGSVAAVASLWHTFAEEDKASAPSDADRLAPNWRRQMLPLRAYLDEHTRIRLIYENQLEAQANAALLANLKSGSEVAITAARRILQQADSPPGRIRTLRERILRLGEQLWQSVGFQTSVKKYGAAAGHRGAVLDYLEVPLNNRWWLEDEFERVSGLPDESARVARLRALATWEDPGSGSFYDDLGHIGRSPHVIFPEARNTHPIGRPNPTYWAWQGGFSRLRQAWLVTLERPYKLRYEGLDPSASYTFRLTGFGEAKPRADGTLLDPKSYGTDEGAIKEFPIPNVHVRDGVLEITFDALNERHLNWRVRSRLSEAWLIRKP